MPGRGASRKGGLLVVSIVRSWQACCCPTSGRAIDGIRSSFQRVELPRWSIVGGCGRGQHGRQWSLLRATFCWWLRRSRSFQVLKSPAANYEAVTSTAPGDPCPQRGPANVSSPTTMGRRVITKKTKKHHRNTNKTSTPSSSTTTKEKRTRLITNYLGAKQRFHVHRHAAGILNPDVRNFWNTPSGSYLADTACITATLSDPAFARGSWFAYA